MAFATTRTRDDLGAFEAFSKGIPAELTVFVKKTYGLLAFSLVLAAMSCSVMIDLMPTRQVMDGGVLRTVPALPPIAFWGLVIGEFAFLFMAMFARGGARQGEVSVFGLVALGGFVLTSGALLGPVVGTYVGLGMASTVAAAAVTTAVTFSTLTAFVFLTGKNFSSWGGILFMGLIALIIGQLLNGFFFRSAGMDGWMSGLGALLFCGFILVDTSRLVHMYGPANMVVPAVLALYLDILNLFLLLLRLMGNRRN